MTSKRHPCSRLTQRLSLQAEVITPDGAGGFTRQWQAVAQLWAEIRPVTGGETRPSASMGREIFAAGQIQSQISHRVFLRRRADVTPAMRLVLGARAFNIRYVAAAEGEQALLELLVQEGVAE